VKGWNFPLRQSWKSGDAFVKRTFFCSISGSIILQLPRELRTRAIWYLPGREGYRFLEQMERGLFPLQKQMVSHFQKPMGQELISLSEEVAGILHRFLYSWGMDVPGLG